MENKSHIIIGVSALSLLALFMFYKSKHIDAVKVPESIQEPVNNNTGNAFVSKTPAQILNGGPSTFNSSNNVTVNQDSARWLSQQYMPIFGLVGVAR